MKTVIFISMVLSFQSVAYGQAGTGSRGGDPTLANQAELKLFIENHVKIRVKKTIEWIAAQKVSSNDLSFQDQVNGLRIQGILKNIDQTSFEFKNECLDFSNQPKAATTTMGEGKSPSSAPICWSLPFMMALAKEDRSQAAIVGLAFHEFIHHFGIADEDHVQMFRFKTMYLNRIRQQASASALKGSQKAVPPPTNCFEETKNKIDDFLKNSSNWETHDQEALRINKPDRFTVSNVEQALIKRCQEKLKKVIQAVVKSHGPESANFVVSRCVVKIVPHRGLPITSVIVDDQFGFTEDICPAVYACTRDMKRLKGASEVERLELDQQRAALDSYIYNIDDQGKKTFGGTLNCGPM